MTEWESDYWKNCWKRRKSRLLLNNCENSLMRTQMNLLMVCLCKELNVFFVHCCHYFDFYIKSYLMSYSYYNYK